MTEWCGEVGSIEAYTQLESRPMTEHWFKVLLAASADGADALGQCVLHSIPATTKRILGQELVVVGDKRLPRMRLDSTGVGSYLSTATDKNKVKAKDKETDVRAYVGSAVSKWDGLAGRRKSHLGAIGRIRSGNKKQAINDHCEFAAKVGVISESFILAQLPGALPAATSVAFLSEGLMQVFLNVASDGDWRPPLHHHNGLHRQNESGSLVWASGLLRNRAQQRLVSAPRIAQAQEHDARVPEPKLPEAVQRAREGFRDARGLPGTTGNTRPSGPQTWSRTPTEGACACG